MALINAERFTIRLIADEKINPVEMLCASHLRARDFSGIASIPSRRELTLIKKLKRLISPSERMIPFLPQSPPAVLSLVNAERFTIRLIADEKIDPVEKLCASHLRAQDFSGIASIPSRHESTLIKKTQKINLTTGANDPVLATISRRQFWHSSMSR